MLSSSFFNENIGIYNAHAPTLLIVLVVPEVVSLIEVSQMFYSCKSTQS